MMTVFSYNNRMPIPKLDPVSRSVLMYRKVRLALGLSALFFGTAALAQPPAAPAPAPAPAAQPPAATGDYLPMKPGSKWVYKVGETTITVKVSAVDAAGTKMETEVNGKAVASEILKSTPEGIVRTKINNSDITPPVLVLKLTGGKVTKGDKWTVASTVQGQSVKGEFTVKDDKEAITVPAGKFDAVVVDGPEFDIAGTKTGIKYYFVAGKGIVKQMYSIQGNEAVLELKEYTEGK